MGYVQLLGKTLGSKRAVRGAIRAKDPWLCFQGALGRYLISRFTIEKEPFPVDPKSEAWRSLMLWPSSKNPHKAMSYTNHGERTKLMYALVGIAVAKVTHGPRIFAARLAEEAGLSDNVSRRPRQQCTVSCVPINQSCQLCHSATMVY